jgi:hypothetical protein
MVFNTTFNNISVYIVKFNVGLIIMSRGFVYSEAFDQDDPTLMDCNPTYNTERPWLPTTNANRFVSNEKSEENRQEH